MSRAYLRPSFVRGDAVVPERRVKRGDTILVSVKGVTKEDGADAGLFENDSVSFVCGDGVGLLIPTLDSVCEGLRIEEEVQLVVRPGDDGHPQSNWDESLVVTVPTGGQAVKVGITVRFQHSGQYRLAKVVKVEEGVATLDMNDPLAGKTLLYRVTVLSMDATVDRHKGLFPPPVYVPEKTFTLTELAVFNGEMNRPIYIGCKELVYDMTTGRSFYGPGGAYGFLAGTDATVPLAKFSLDPRLANAKWKLEDFDDEELRCLANYVKTFSTKYPVVGKIWRGSS